MNYVKQMLEAAAKDGLEIVVSYDDEVDYSGRDPAEALAHTEACDEINVTLHAGESRMRVGWCLIINGLAPDEVIADTAGPWMTKWWEENVR